MAVVDMIRCFGSLFVLFHLVLNFSRWDGGLPLPVIVDIMMFVFVVA